MIAKLEGDMRDAPDKDFTIAMELLEEARSSLLTKKYDLAREKIMEPLRIAGKKAEKLDIDVNVEGGGFMGQAYATRTAIAKGIVAYTSDEKLEATFKEYDRSLLVSDPRRKMPKKPLGRGARKRRQKSYR